MVRVGLIQMRCEKGAIAENLASLSRYLAEAAMRNVDIVGFPEMRTSPGAGMCLRQMVNVCTRRRIGRSAWFTWSLG
jgi:predicted amidohydrolase